MPVVKDVEDMKKELAKIQKEILEIKSEFLVLVQLSTQSAGNIEAIVRKIKEIEDEITNPLQPVN